MAIGNCRGRGGQQARERPCRLRSEPLRTRTGRLGTRQGAEAAELEAVAGAPLHEWPSAGGQQSR